MLEGLGDEPRPQRAPPAPPSGALCAGVNPAWPARRRIISFTACLVIAAVPMAPVRCTVGNTARPGSTGAGNRLVRQQCRVKLRIIWHLLVALNGTVLERSYARGIRRQRIAADEGAKEGLRPTRRVPNSANQGAIQCERRHPAAVSPNPRTARSGPVDAGDRPPTRSDPNPWVSSRVVCAFRRDVRFVCFGWWCLVLGMLVPRRSRRGGDPFLVVLS